MLPGGGDSESSYHVTQAFVTLGQEVSRGWIWAIKQNINIYQKWLLTQYLQL